MINCVVSGGMVCEQTSDVSVEGCLSCVSQRTRTSCMPSITTDTSVKAISELLLMCCSCLSLRVKIVRCALYGLLH